MKLSRYNVKTINQLFLLSFYYNETFILKVNTGGTFNTIRLAAGVMAKNQADNEGQKGVIVNLTSVHAFEGSTGNVAFATSSGCIVSMTLPIARDLAAEGIRCCAVAPGM